MNSASTNKYIRGSEWRKWDLHFHTKETNKNDQFTSANFEAFCISLFKKALENNISAFGITDYFNIENYKKVVSFVEKIDTNTNFTIEEKERIKKVFILPNVELRMLPVTDSGRLINIHCLFNPAFLPSIENDFFGSIDYSAGTGTKFKMNRQGFIDLGKSLEPGLGDEKAYERGINTFVVSHGQLQALLDENSKFRENVIIAVSNSNKDGASALQKHYDLFEDDAASSLDAVRKSIYILSECIFSGNENDVKHFLGKKKDDKETVIRKSGSLKPCIHGSDAHKEDELFKPFDDKFCWIKADPTFEGLKQIKYEPDERVKIGPIKPDQKDDYKIIRKIKFTDSSDFPQEIEFNSNLCSIIGSRSSGKSALLAYIAHAVDPELTERMREDGPGDGEAYHWSKITLQYSIEWANGKSNDDSPGKIVYIPQNYLFEKSKDPNEIKKKIEPVLFKILPDFETMYRQTETKIEAHNQKIADQINTWFELSDSIPPIDDQLKNLGDKKAIEQEKVQTDLNIVALKDKNQLSDDEIKEYKKIKSDVSTLASRIKEIETELSPISNVTERSNFFGSAKITLSPALASLPQKLQDLIKESLAKNEAEILATLNKEVGDFQKSILKEKKEKEEEIIKIKDKNKVLIEKYKSNLELESLVKKLNELSQALIKIENTEKIKKGIQEQLQKCIPLLKSEIDHRKTSIEELTKSIESADQSSLKGIDFGVEYGFDNNLDIVTQKVNIRDRSVFIEGGQLKIEEVREKPGDFLNAIYSGQQKIIAYNDKKKVAQDILSLTEKILFSAEMEGDKIGGFREPTMTPGKRALFALRLILAESDDTWPLLIDQPEDDLDSRSIYDEVVPFLKERKKERQIIMVSHNANLVIGADSEQLIIANRNGSDRKNEDGKQFNYLTGSLEFTKDLDTACPDTLKSQGVCEHACAILDGGRTAFEMRKNKYNIK